MMESQLQQQQQQLQQRRQKVEHQKFGFGEVVKMEGSAHNPIATVKFELNGEKKIMLNYAKLRIVEWSVTMIIQTKRNWMPKYIYTCVTILLVLFASADLFALSIIKIL